MSTDERSFQTRVDELKREVSDQMAEEQGLAQEILVEALDIINEMASMLNDRHCYLSEMEEY